MRDKTVLDCMAIEDILTIIGVILLVVLPFASMVLREALQILTLIIEAKADDGKIDAQEVQEILQASFLSTIRIVDANFLGSELPE